MDVSCKATRILFEGAETLGLSRHDIIEPLGLDVDHLSSASGRVSWSTFTQVIARVSSLLSDDVERLRLVGRRMVRVPAQDTLQKLARGIVSVNALYTLCNRWLGPSLFPHLPMMLAFPAGHRVRFSCKVPEPHAGSAAFFHIFEGVISETPCLLGLRAARIERSDVSARGFDTTFVMPESSPLLQRVKAAVRAAVHAREALVLLEEQREELEQGISAMQRMSNEFHTLLEGLPDLVIIHREGLILWVNQTTLTTLGYAAAGDLVGRPLLDVVDDTSKRLVLERMRVPAGLAPEAGGAPAVTEGRLRRLDGELVLVEVAPTQSVIFGGAPARLVVGRDMTERMRMQQRLVTADRLASVGMLAAGVAHEINNPLAYVLGNIELVTRELAPLGESTARARESLGIALEGVGRIRAIVRDLLTLSRADDGDETTVDVHEVMEATLALAAKPIGERARILRNYGAVTRARADARLGQVFLNLIVNALEAMGERPVDRNELRITTSHDASGRVVIEVSDTGTGIDADLRHRVFDPFFTTKPVGSGTGLGLAICERIVSELGGEISMVSTPGAGATFRVALKAAEGAAEGALPPLPSIVAPPDVAGAVAGRSGRVLVVDDEPHLLASVTAALGEHHVASAASARAALDIVAHAATTPFDVILCDLMMPGETGMDFYAALERLDPSQCERVIFMTGGAFTDQARAFLEMTQRPCLDKPFGIEGLRAAIAQSMSGGESGGG